MPPRGLPRFLIAMKTPDLVEIGHFGGFGGLGPKPE